MRHKKQKIFTTDTITPGAQRVFGLIKERVGDANKAKTYEANEFLCAAYEAWDNLDMPIGKQNLCELLGILQQFKSLVGLASLSGLVGILNEQEKALDCLERIINDEKLALGIPDGFHFAFMLYHNALRREAQEKLDMACLILYRLLEWVAQHRLFKHGINTSDPDYSQPKMGKEQLAEKFTKKRKEVYGDESASTLPDKISLVDGFFLLDILQDEIVEKLNWQAFCVNLRFGIRAYRTWYEQDQSKKF